MFSPGAQLVTIATVKIVPRANPGKSPSSSYHFASSQPLVVFANLSQFKPIRYHLFYRRRKMSGEHRGTSRDLSHKRPDLPGQEGTGARFFGAY